MKAGGNRDSESAIRLLQPRGLQNNPLGQKTRIGISFAILFSISLEEVRK